MARTPFLALQGSYTNAVAALTAYYETPPQLYFIHIEHGEIDSFQFCQWLKPSTYVVFISESREYAADCFRLHALDYLLTPLTYSLFMDAVSRVFRLMGVALPPEVAEQETATTQPPQSLFIKSDYRMLRVDLPDITYIEAMGDYVRIHFATTAAPIMSLCSLKNMEQILDGDDFIRVHRSYIVRKDKIRLMEHGNIIFGKTSIPIGESYRKQFQTFFGEFAVL